MALLPLLVALAGAPADTVRVVLVATADVHAHVTDWDYVQNAPWPGGLVRAGSVIDSLRQRYPGQVVVVDAGDLLQGTPLGAYYGGVAPRRPHPVVDVMNVIGYDAATIGTHDFDFGLERFAHAVADASFPWVSANLRVLPEDTLAFHPYTIIQRGPIKIAVSGFLTPGTMVWHRQLLQGRYRVDRLERDAERILREMRRDADVAVVLSHGGLGGPSSYDTTGVGEEDGAWRFAAAENRPDLVVLGHSHGELLDTVVSGVHFVQPQPFAQALAVVHLWLAERDGKWRPFRITAERVPLAERAPSSRAQRRLAEPHHLTTGWVSTVIGQAAGRFSSAAARAEDTPLVRFIQDVQRRATGAVLSATPVFDLRATLEPGEITIGAIYRLYPHEYALRSVRLSGDQLKAYLEQSAWYYYADSTGRIATNRYVSGSDFDLVAGIEYVIDLSQPMGSRITSLQFRGRPVLPSDTFTVALNSLRQQGGGRFRALAGAPLVSNRGGTVRDLLIAEIRRRKVLDPKEYAGTSWRIEPAEAARRARALFVRDTTLLARAEEPAPPPFVLPVGPSRRELAARDSAERERERAESIGNLPVARLRLPAEPGEGRALPRLLADAFRSALRADVAMLTYAETGVGLPAGRVTARQVEAAVAGTERLLSFVVTGEELEAILENVVASGQPCCEVAGLRARYDLRRKPYERVRAVELSSGQAIDRKQGYMLVISSRLVTADSVFMLGATRCLPDKGCAESAPLTRWRVVVSPKTPAEALQEYLRVLPQPVAPPEDRRLLPVR